MSERTLRQYLKSVSISVYRDGAQIVGSPAMLDYVTAEEIENSTAREGIYRALAVLPEWAFEPEAGLWRRRPLESVSCWGP